MPRKRPISDIVSDIKDTNPPPSNIQKQVTTRWVARDITIPVYVSPRKLTPDAPRRRPIVWSHISDSNFSPFFIPKFNIHHEELTASVQCQSVEPCEKHEPTHQEPAKPKYPRYELPKLEEIPLRCDGEIENLVSKAHLFPIKRIIICNGQPSITLYTREIFSLFRIQQKDLHLCRTFNLGPCYMTMFVLRQKNLINKFSKTKTAPLFVGPVLLHFDRSADTYEEFLSNIRDKFELPYDVYNGELKGIPKNDRPLLEATRSVFGWNMRLAGRQHGTGSIRKEMHEGSRGIKPTDTIESVVRHIEKWIFNIQSEGMRNAFQGKWDGDYKMTASARKHVSQWYECQDAYQKFLELVPDCY